MLIDESLADHFELCLKACNCDYDVTRCDEPLPYKDPHTKIMFAGFKLGVACAVNVMSDMQANIIKDVLGKFSTENHDKM